MEHPSLARTGLCRCKWVLGWEASDAPDDCAPSTVWASNPVSSLVQSAILETAHPASSWAQSPQCKTALDCEADATGKRSDRTAQGFHVHLSSLRPAVQVSSPLVRLGL